MKKYILVCISALAILTGFAESGNSFETIKLQGIGFNGFKHTAAFTRISGVGDLFWLFWPSLVDDSTTRPLIVWLDGVTGVPPIGTGYSKAEDENNISTNFEDHVDDLVSVLKSFYEIHKEYTNTPVYVFGQGHGAQFAVALAARIAEKSQFNNVIKGVGIGNGIISPALALTKIGFYLEEFGKIDSDGRRVVENYSDKINRLTNNGRYGEAFDLFLSIKKVINVNAGAAGINLDDIAEKLTRDKLQEYFNRRLSAEQYRLMEETVPPLLGLSGNVVYDEQREAVLKAFRSSFMKPAVEKVEYLLQNTNISVTIYNGNLDAISNTPGQLLWVDNLRWSGQKDFLNDERKPFLWLTFGASLAFLIIGLVRGYSASSIPSIESLDPTFIQHSEQKSWIGAIPPLGAFVGSMLSGPLMQRAGRKRTLQMTAPLLGGGWLLLGFAPGFALILVGRFMSGLCVGFVLAPAQVYVSECCDPEIRGRLGSLPTLSMSLGILISYVAGNWLYWRHLAFLSAVSECCDPEIRGRLGSLPTLSMSLGILISYVAGNWLYWRHLAFLSAVFCAALFLVLLPLPESPVWLKARGLDAEPSIKWLQLSNRAVAIVKDDDKHTEKAPETEPKSLFTREVFLSSAVMKPLIVGFALLIFQQFSGIDAVIFFTVEIFQSAGSKLDAMTATIIVGAVQLISNGVSTMLVDRAGRRPLLLLSAVTMCVSMASMGAAFYFQFEAESWLGYLPIVSLVVFMLGFSLGFGGLPFLLLGELFPTQYRSQLSAMASAVNLLSMFTVIKSYHALEAVLTSAGTFWMYTAFCAMAFFFVLFMVPETKGKSLAEIEEHFRGKKRNEIVHLQTIS
ncbi:Facilitated trehalose transporter Tret1 [Papilio machaon]|uniref:Facilitated trehalose transporter Tret1 n=1 Tax=Papilio machaon TaxID=76193 RepID=A0A194QNN2_PAPMA|nr:Facilitated trehalose transporter Tret1 [Papilio machaon]